MGEEKMMPKLKMKSINGTRRAIMPKAKPVSLHPLSFEEAIKVLTKVTPKPEKKKSKHKK